MQTCTVHLIRAAMRFISYTDRKKVAAALRPVYTAPTVEAAEAELLAFAESALGRKYPAAVMTWQAAWDRFIPFLAFPPELRRIARESYQPSTDTLPALSLARTLRMPSRVTVAFPSRPPVIVSS